MDNPLVQLHQSAVIQFVCGFQRIVCQIQRCRPPRKVPGPPGAPPGVFRGFEEPPGVWAPGGLPGPGGLVDGGARPPGVWESGFGTPGGPGGDDMAPQTRKFSDFGTKF